MRDLSLIGRILITKTLGISKFVFVSTVTDINEDIVKEVTRLIYNFIWKSKRPRIKRTTLIGDYSQGGLRAPDFETMIKSQKVMWIKRFLDSNSSLWKEVINHYLKDKGGVLYVHCNFDVDDKYTILPPFYKTCLRAWKHYLNEVKYRKSPKTQFLWNNTNIKVQGKTIYYQDFMRVGIWTVSDLYANLKIIPFAFWKRKGLRQERYMAWSGLLAAIPCRFKQIIKDGVISPQDTSLKLNSQKSFSDAKGKDFYNILIESKYQRPTAEAKYDIIITEEEWANIYLLPWIVFSDTKSRVFQYKCLHRLISSNDFLYVIGKRENSLCSFCKTQEDSLEHLLYQCDIVQQFWINIVDTLLLPLGINNLTNLEILFGIDINDPPKLANQIIILAKDFILQEKYTETKPRFNSFIAKVESLYLLEEHITTKSADWNKIQHVF